MARPLKPPSAAAAGGGRLCLCRRFARAALPGGWRYGDGNHGAPWETVGLGTARRKPTDCCNYLCTALIRSCTLWRKWMLGAGPGSFPFSSFRLAAAFRRPIIVQEKMALDGWTLASSRRMKSREDSAAEALRLLQSCLIRSSGLGLSSLPKPGRDSECSFFSQVGWRPPGGGGRKEVLGSCPNPLWHAISCGHRCCQKSSLARRADARFTQ